MFVSNANAIWLTDGSAECMNVHRYVSVCVCARVRVQRHVFMNCLSNTSCKVVTKKLAVWSYNFYLLEKKKLNFFFC